MLGKIEPAARAEFVGVPRDWDDLSYLMEDARLRRFWAWEMPSVEYEEGVENGMREGGGEVARSRMRYSDGEEKVGRRRSLMGKVGRKVKEWKWMEG